MPVEIMCRLIRVPQPSLTPLAHCYLRITENGVPRTIGLYPKADPGDPASGRLLGHVFRNHPDDIGGVRVAFQLAPGKSDEQVIACLEEGADSYPVGTYEWLGPNSNTFVAHCARRCLGIQIAMPDGAWGWDKTPPFVG